MNQIFFCYLIAKPKNEVYILFLALEGESKLIQITNFENSNKKFVWPNCFYHLPSILCQLLSDCCYQMNLKKKWKIFNSSETTVMCENLVIQNLEWRHNFWRQVIIKLPWIRGSKRTKKENIWICLF